MWAVLRIIAVVHPCRGAKGHAMDLLPYRGTARALRG